MQKTITIDGKEVSFKSTAATPMKYKAYFQSDLFKDIIKMFPVLENVSSDADHLTNLSYENLLKIDFDVFYQVAWILAKGADPNLPDMMQWLDRFDKFPFGEVLIELQGLILDSIGGDQKKVHPALKR